MTIKEIIKNAFQGDRVQTLRCLSSVWEFGRLRTGNPEINRILNEELAKLPPITQSNKNIRLYRGMSRCEARAILDRKYNEVGCFYTQLRDKAAGYSNNTNGYVCEIIVPLTCVKDHNEYLNQDIISPLEAFPQSERIIFYKAFPLSKLLYKMFRRRYKPYICFRVRNIDRI